MYEYLDRRYAMALYEVAEKAGKVEEFKKDLKEIIEIMDANHEFIIMMKHPQFPTTTKKKILKEIFEDKIDYRLLNFLLLLLKKNRLLFIQQKYVEYEKIYLEKHGSIIANVVTAVPLLERQKNILICNLEKKYSKKVILKEAIDKDIVAGIYLRIGDDVIDQSVKFMFNEIKENVLRKH
ncbi:F0F1 ATP synthase subunit delta [Clostridium sp. DL1XJH146]